MSKTILWIALVVVLMIGAAWGFNYITTSANERAELAAAKKAAEARALQEKAAVDAETAIDRNLSNSLKGIGGIFGPVGANIGKGLGDLLGQFT